LHVLTGRRNLTFTLWLILLKPEKENIKLESDQKIENLSLQISTGHVEINHTYIYLDRDAADEINIKSTKIKFDKLEINLHLILDSKMNYYQYPN